MRVAWLAVVLLLAGCEDSSRKARHHDHVARIVYAVDLEAADPSLRKAALEHTVTTMRARVDALHLADATVTVERDMVVLTLPDVDQAAFDRIRDSVPRSTHLELRLAEHDSTYMRDLYRAVRADPQASGLGVEAEVDGWSGPDAQVTDYYLHALDRAALERYVAAYPLPPDRALVYEVTRGAPGTPPYWRTHYVEAAPRLDGSAVARATLVDDPQTHRADVQVDFDDDGKAAFSALTASALGKKVVILLDGTVKSAPVVQGRIDGGRAIITMGSDPDLDVVRRDAESLVANLRAGALPVPLLELSATLSDGT